MINSDLIYDLCTGQVYPMKYTVVKTSVCRCNIPPIGWQCSRGYGHDGPCAARLDISAITNDDACLDALSGICGDAFELEETTKPGRQIPRIDFDFTAYPDGTVGQQPETAEKEYPHKCLSCGSKAFIGFSSTDCSNSSCGNYKG